MKELTWSWVAGFFQAEGYVSKLGARKPLQLCQKQREPLDAIRDFWLCELPETTFPKVGGPYASGVYELYAFAGFLSVVVKLYSQLRGAKRQRARSWLESTLPDEFQGFLKTSRPLDMDWVTGFWEGDGTITLNDRAYPVLKFAQNDCSLLEEVRGFLGVGVVSDEGNAHFKLHIYLGRHSCPNSVRALLEGVRLSYRLEQIERVMSVNVTY